MNRAERRRDERDRRRRRAVIIGDGLVAATVGKRFNADNVEFAKLPEKLAGQHRWVAAASFVLDMPDRLLEDAATHKLLDDRNMMYLGVGCWDCERSFGEASGQPCQAEAAAES